MKESKKVLPNSLFIQTFQYGIDLQPLWFRDIVQRSTIVELNETFCHLHFKTVYGYVSLKASKGNYILMPYNGEFSVVSEEHFKLNYTEI